MYCSKCGREVEADSRFCGICGAKIDQSAKQNLPETPILSKENVDMQEYLSRQQKISVDQKRYETDAVEKVNPVSSEQPVNAEQQENTEQPVNVEQQENTEQPESLLQHVSPVQPMNLVQPPNPAQPSNQIHPTNPVYSTNPVQSTNPVYSTIPAHPVKPVKQKNMKAIVVTMVSLILLTLGVCGFLWYNKMYIPDQYDKKLELGEEYLGAGNYDKAIAAYHDAIDLLSDRVEAHVGLSEAYIAMGEYDQAMITLEDGYEITQKGIIKDRIEQLQEELADLDVESLEGTAVESAEEVGDTEADPVTDSNPDQATLQENPEVVTPMPLEQENIDIVVRQVDNTSFPNVTFYASVTDVYGETVKELAVNDFKIQEIGADGTVVDIKINDVYQVISSDQIFVNLVLDISDSMNEDYKMSQAQIAANSFVEKVDLGQGDSVEIISFNDYVYLEQEFTSELGRLSTAINSLQASGATALYDAIYAGLLQSFYQDGSKCVIIFTDGQENASSYTWDDVVDMAKNTGIPVFIIGIGADYDASALTALAQECSGAYYSADTTDLSQILEQIYYSIYQDTQEYYVFEYVSQNKSNTDMFRSIEIKTAESSKYIGEAYKEYVPQANISGDFSSLYASNDYMIEDSDTKALTEADLNGMSLAQLRIARNEIFARHGRQFKDSALNKWFYSKTWYLNIGMKYAPDVFDKISPSPLSKLESDNASFIKTYEKQMMENQDIYPNATYELLSDYDLALSKSVLKKALQQMQSYPDTDVLQENLIRVQNAIDQEDISY